MIRKPDDADRSPADDPLDHLLAEACWPEPTRAAKERLTIRWQHLSSVARRRQLFLRRVARVALVACLVGAVAIGWLALRRRDAAAPRPDGARMVGGPGQNQPTRSPVIAQTPKTQHTARRPTTIATAPDAAAPRHQPLFLTVSRPPDALEQILFADVDRPRKPSAQSGVQPNPKSRDHLALVAPTTSSRPARNDELAAVDAAIQKLTADPNADAAVIATPIRALGPRGEAALLDVLNGTHVERRIAALRLLAEFGSRAAVAEVINASTDPKLHASAISTLARLADSSTIVELASAEPDAELQQTLLAALLSRDDATSLVAYLKFVDNEQTAEEALAAASRVKDPPMDLLFAMLADPLESTRIAAARVIGRIDGPEATSRLIAMVERGSGRQEACLALLSSRGDEAVRYVSAARTNPMLASIFESARFLLPKDSQPRS